MTQRNFSKTEQNIARGVNLAIFCGDYDPYRFSISNKGYLLDSKNPNWVYDISRLWWYDNSKNPKQKNGNAIDWLMYYEGYSFPETMRILLAYSSEDDWRQYLHNSQTQTKDAAPDYEDAYVLDETAEYPFA